MSYLLFFQIKLNEKLLKFSIARRGKGGCDILTCFAKGDARTNRDDRMSEYCTRSRSSTVIRNVPHTGTDLLYAHGDP